MKRRLFGFIVSLLWLLASSAANASELTPVDLASVLLELEVAGPGCNPLSLEVTVDQSSTQNIDLGCNVLTFTVAGNQLLASIADERIPAFYLRATAVVDLPASDSAAMPIVFDPTPGTWLGGDASAGPAGMLATPVAPQSGPFTVIGLEGESLELTGFRPHTASTSPQVTLQTFVVDPTLENPTSECDDGIDNDGDGRIDTRDVGCHLSGGTSESATPGP